MGLNILFITTDQQRRDSLARYGLDFVHTPAIDRIAEHGVVFDHALAAAPVCQPCRAAFITGQYPNVNGVTSNFKWIRPGTPTIAGAFAEAGWQTAAIGKMHFHPWDNPEGFQHRIIAEDKRHFFRPDDHAAFLDARGHRRQHPASVAGYDEWLGAIQSPLPEELHIDRFIGDEAVRYLESVGDDPFFCWVSFNSPHDPYDPPARLADRYRDAPIPDAIGGVEELDSKPDYQRKILEFFGSNPLYLHDFSQFDDRRIRRMREHYYATITFVDEQIGRIFEVLDRRRLTEDTLVVFSSDHGDHLGDHGLPYKGTFYESSVGVPLVVSGPGVSEGARTDSFADWVDLHRTFLSVAGIEAPAHVQGEDLSPIFRNPQLPGRTEGFSELAGRAMVCNADYKLVVCDDGGGELYDLHEDPLEVTNHFGDEAYREIQSELALRLARREVAHGTTTRFGGGSHASDEGRDRALAEAKEAEARGEFPGRPRP